MPKRTIISRRPRGTKTVISEISWAPRCRSTAAPTVLDESKGWGSQRIRCGLPRGHVGDHQFDSYVTWPRRGAR